jgi:hypothetical protein
VRDKECIQNFGGERPENSALGNLENFQSKSRENWRLKRPVEKHRKL